VTLPRFYSLSENEVTVTVAMRLFLNGSEEMIPNDWSVHVVLEGNHTRVTVERQGEFMTLSRALALRDALTTSSRPHLRRPLRDAEPMVG